jgi:hypothetical protein
VKHTEFWTRMEEALGRAYARSWASMFVLTDLEGRTVDEALAADVPPKQVWRAVWAALGLPARER